MAVHDRHHVGPRAVELAVDIEHEEALALVAGQRFAVCVELHEIRRGDERRRERARHDEALGVLIAARAHVPIGVEHFVLREDTARGDEVFNERVARGEFRLLHWWRSSLRTGDTRYSRTIEAIAVAASIMEALRTPAASESGPATSAPSEMKAGFSMRSAEMRPRIASGAPICTMAMLLEACAISAAPPTTLNTSATANEELKATPMIDAAMTTTHTD